MGISGSYENSTFSDLLSSMRLEQSDRFTESTFRPFQISPESLEQRQAVAPRALASKTVCQPIPPSMEAMLPEVQLGAMLGEGPDGFNRGVEQLRLCKWQDAGRAFEQALEIDPDIAEAWLGLGICLLHMGRAGEALIALERYIKRDPSNRAGLSGLAVALQGAEKFTDALHCYVHLLADDPDSEQLLTNAAACALPAGEYDLTRELAARHLRLKPRSREALAFLAAATFAKGEFQQASVCYARLTAANPDSFEDWFNLGVCYQRIGWDHQALQAFTAALNLKPDDCEAMRGCAAALGESEEAVEAWKKLLATDPEDADSWFRLGYVRLARKEAGDAACAFENCLRRHPNWLDAAWNLAIAYQRLGDRKAAAEAFEKVIELEPSNAEAALALSAIPDSV